MIEGSLGMRASKTLQTVEHRCMRVSGTRICKRAGTLLHASRGFMEEGNLKNQLHVGGKGNDSHSWRWKESDPPRRKRRD